jgi:hypothetical protein
VDESRTRAHSDNRPPARGASTSATLTTSRVSLAAGPRLQARRLGRIRDGGPEDGTGSTSRLEATSLLPPGPVEQLAQICGSGRELSRVRFAPRGRPGRRLVVALGGSRHPRGPGRERSVCSRSQRACRAGRRPGAEPPWSSPQYRGRLFLAIPGRATSSRACLDQAPTSTGASGGGPEGQSVRRR